jgi:hypothetical protein
MEEFCIDRELTSMEDKADEELAALLSGVAAGVQAAKSRKPGTRNEAVRIGKGGRMKFSTYLVPWEGLEPSIHYWNTILSRARIPFRHHGW